MGKAKMCQHDLPESVELLQRFYRSFPNGSLAADALLLSVSHQRPMTWLLGSCNQGCHWGCCPESPALSHQL